MRILNRRWASAEKILCLLQHLMQRDLQLVPGSHPLHIFRMIFRMSRSDIQYILYLSIIYHYLISIFRKIVVVSWLGGPVECFEWDYSRWGYIYPYSDVYTLCVFAERPDTGWYMFYTCINIVKIILHDSLTVNSYGRGHALHWSLVTSYRGKWFFPGNVNKHCKKHFLIITNRNGIKI